MSTRLAPALAATLAVAAVGLPAAAHAGRVVVLPVAGDPDGEFEGGLLAIVEDRHDVVSSREFERLARRVDDDLDRRDIAALARSLQLDAVVEGRVTELDDGLSFVVRIRGRDGRTIKKITVETPGTRLTRRVRDRLGTGVLDGIDRVLGLLALPGDEAVRAAGEGGADGDAGAVRGAGADTPFAADWRRPTLRLAAGPSGTQRTLAFVSRDFPQAPLGYQSSMVPGARLEAEAYPLASAGGAPAGFGAALELDRTLLLTTRSGDAPDIALPTTQHRWFASARYRAALGRGADRPTLTAGLGYGARVFSVDTGALPDGARLDLPDVNYRFVAPELWLRWPVGARAVVHGGGRVMFVRSAGEIETADSYGSAAVTGVDAAAGVDVRLAGALSLSVTGSFTRIGYDFAGDGAEATSRDLDPATVDVGGAEDRYLGASAALAYGF